MSDSPGNDPIPHVIHRVWFGDNPEPEEFRLFEERWRKLHPGWELITWRDSDVRGLPTAEEIDDLEDVVVKSDLARYAIVYREGGVYVDADFEPLRNIQPLLAGESLVLGEVPRGLVTNSFLAAAPRHSFLSFVLAEAQTALNTSRDRPANLVVGPAFFTRCYERWCAVTGEGAAILSRDTLYPYAWNQERPPASAYLPTTYAVHHWARSWSQQVAEEPRPAPRPRRRDAGRMLAKKMAIKSKQLGGRLARPWRETVDLQVDPRPRIWGTGLGDGRIFVNTQHGFPLMALAQDLNLAPALLVDGSYGPEYVDAMSAILRVQDIFVDVGAAIGLYTCAAAKLVGPEGRVFAFEPNPELCDLLRTNIYMNRMLGHIDADVAVFECAASDRQGNAELSYELHDPGQGTIVGDSATHDAVERVEVATTTLDHVLADLTEIRLLKVDVEGAELQVINGALGLIRAGRVRYLDLELEHGKLGAEWRDLIQFLRDLQNELAAETYWIDAAGSLAPLSIDEAVQQSRLAHFVLHFPAPT
jgi:FkbM family methyltransferase